MKMERKTAVFDEKPQKVALTSENNKKNPISKLFSKKHTPLIIVFVCLLLSVSVAVGSFAAVISLVTGRFNRHNAVYSADSTYSTADSDGRIEFNHPDLGTSILPAIEGVPISQYKDENFSYNENGLMEYRENGELLSYAGIDVSAHNGDIDWRAVKDFGIDFAFIRIGGRGYGYEGVIYDDDYFYENLHEARSAGIMVGAYFYSTAITPEEAKKEAEYCLSRLNGVSLDYPLVFDWEVVDPSESPRNLEVEPDTLTKCARAFCDTVKEAGYVPSIYTDSKKAYFKFDLAVLSDVDIWYTYYNDKPNMYYNYTVWQYSSDGYVDGIQGNTDLNISFKNYK